MILGPIRAEKATLLTKDSIDYIGFDSYDGTCMALNVAGGL